VKALYDNGREAPTHLAKTTTHSWRTVKTVYDDLLDRKVIRVRGLRNLRVQLDPEIVTTDQTLAVYQVYQFLGTGGTLDEVAEEFSKIEWVEDVVSITGEYDLLVKFHVPNMKVYYELVNGPIQSILKKHKIPVCKDLVSTRIFKEKPFVEAGFEAHEKQGEEFLGILS